MKEKTKKVYHIERVFLSLIPAEDFISYLYRNFLEEEAFRSSQERQNIDRNE